VSGDKTNTIKQRKNTNKVALRPGLCGDNLITTKMHLHKSLSSQSLGNYRQFNPNYQETEHIQTQTNDAPKVASNKQLNTLIKLTLRERTERAWFSCLLQYLARKRSGSIITILEPACGRTVWTGFFLTGQMPFLLPNQQFKRTEWRLRKSHEQRTSHRSCSLLKCTTSNLP